MRMTRWASFTALVLISVVGLFVPRSVALADDVSVTAVVAAPGSEPPPNPIVGFIGVAAPNATMVIIRGGAAITSGVANGSANFTFLLADQPVGQQIYEIHATDTDGRTLTPLNFALNLAAGSTTSLNGIFLGPSIAIDHPAVTIGANVTITGQTYPGSTVTVTVNTTPIKQYQVIADSSGRWQSTVSTNDFGVGTFTIYARASSSIAGESELSANVSLEVGPLGEVIPPTNTNTVPAENTNTTPAENTNAAPAQNTNTTPPVPDPFAGKASADLNGDGRVNLIDLSILLFYWPIRHPANARADISNDGIVGITDFSIMLFQWTG